MNPNVNQNKTNNENEQNSQTENEKQIVSCDEEYLSVTTNFMKRIEQDKLTENVPFGFVVTPLAELKKGSKLPKVPVVHLKNALIPRCKQCHSYVNQYTKFFNRGNSWQCNMCKTTNITHHNYFSELNQQGKRKDFDERPELYNPVVEFVAGKEYCQNNPLSTGYFFLINVSQDAIQSGLVNDAVNTIINMIENNLIHGPNQKIGIATFHSDLHFYNLNPKLSEPRMVVLPDLNDIFPPSLSDFFVPLESSRDLILSLLEKIPSLFQNTKENQNSLTSAIQICAKVIGSAGAKLIVFQHGLPTLTKFALKDRLNLQNPNETQSFHLLNPTKETPFYQNLAIMCTRQQIAIYLFLFSQRYSDASTLGNMAKSSSGKIFYYRNYSSSNIQQKTQFIHDLENTLSIQTGLEGVLRTRFSSGVTVSKFYANCSISSNDLLQLPIVTPEDTFAFEVVINPGLFTDSTIYLQSALLYTTSSSQRRVRIINYCGKMSNNLKEVLESYNFGTLMNILLRRGLFQLKVFSLQTIRDRFTDFCVQMIKTWKLVSTQQIGIQTTFGQTATIELPESLNLLPLYTFGLIKNRLFNTNNREFFDEISSLMIKMNGKSNSQVLSFLYPYFYPLHNLPSDCGIISQNGLTFPQRLSLSKSHLISEGIFLITNGNDAFIWIGNNANKKELISLIGTEKMNETELQHLELIRNDQDDYNKRVWNIIEGLQQFFGSDFLITILQEGNFSDRNEFNQLFVEEKNQIYMNYSDFYNNLLRAIRL
eukprot:Anaeramoba_ignava/a348592_17.p1 GENE.a348592_17~~a348592_17.p1  ORF type:complete len:764 (+),score=226.14 a348592_17:818-3109(+)